MAKPKASLNSSLRKSLFGVYRARGKGLNNIWLVSSIKTKQDWILPSDRQLIHWLHFLESNPDVVDFNLAPEPILSHDENEPRNTELDAIVTYKDKHTEWHEVKAGKAKQKIDHKSQFQAQSQAAFKSHANYQIFDDDDLKPNVKVAMRWLKPLAYANALQGQDHKHCESQLALCLHSLNSGNIQQVLDKMKSHDQSIVIGLIAKFSFEGLIKLDLEKSTFGYLTLWNYHG